MLLHLPFMDTSIKFATIWVLNSTLMKLACAVYRIEVGDAVLELWPFFIPFGGKTFIDLYCSKKNASGLGGGRKKRF